MFKLKNPPWSDLPKDILGCIMAHLSFTDQCRFRTVCKKWRSIHGVKPNEKFPWLLIFNDRLCTSMQEYHLYNISARKAYTIKLNKAHMKRFLPVCGASIKCVRSGWLLINPRGEGLFLYNTFSQDIVNLPVFPISGRLLQFIFAFTCCPKWRHFVVHAVDKFVKDEGKISIHTWFSGTKQWQTNNITPTSDCMDEVFKLESVKRNLYCVFTSGAVGTFNGKKWALLVNSENLKFSAFIKYELPTLYLPPELVECQEELFLVYRRYRGRFGWYILRLDQLNQTWVEEDSLGKRTLFSSDTSFCHSVVMVSAESELRNYLTGCIYYRDLGLARLGFFEYSKDAGRGDERVGGFFHGSSSIEFPWPRGGPPFKKDFTALWIEPPAL